MELVRIGEKIINRERLYKLVDRILTLRSNGATQQDVADTLDLERPFISNLERLGEIRIGRKIALVGFSVSNKKEVKKIAKEHGIDFVHLYNGEIISNFIAKAEEIDERGLLHKVLKTMSTLRNFDLLIFLGSAREATLLERALGTQVLNIPVNGEEKDKHFADPQTVEDYLDSLIPIEGGKGTEGDSERKFRFFKKGSRGRSKSSRRKVQD